MEEKIKAWGVKQSIWGSSSKVYYWFSTQEERDKYVERHDNLDLLRGRMVEKGNVFQTYDAWRKWFNNGGKTTEEKLKEKYGINDAIAGYIEKRNPKFWDELINDNYSGDPVSEMTAYKALYVIENKLISNDELAKIIDEAINKRS